MKYAEEHGKQEAGRKYDVDEKCVRYWIKQKDALAATNRSQKVFRGKKCRYPELEGELVKYVIDTRRDGYNVSTDMIRMKALAIARHMEIPQAQFNASRGWATRFTGYVVTSSASAAERRFFKSFQASTKAIPERLRGDWNCMNGTEDNRLWEDAEASSSENEDSDSEMES
ncbi:hypothetical protein HPB52_006211 [Rhipicephalus sanguineus]|uniref:HTH CENPB-type domain-containing protein n=1 Tax=Rhipicephalus sanguineus TaxID=34632 RepID=A0A9D4QJT7_RHISA|nr:hypothetical protein HPB52_006211 [Rhipicephalus sanguineus]